MLTIVLKMLKQTSEDTFEVTGKKEEETETVASEVEMNSSVNTEKESNISKESHVQCCTVSALEEISTAGVDIETRDGLKVIGNSPQTGENVKSSQYNEPEVDFSPTRNSSQSGEAKAELSPADKTVNTFQSNDPEAESSQMDKAVENSPSVDPNGKTTEKETEPAPDSSFEGEDAFLSLSRKSIIIPEAQSQQDSDSEDFEMANSPLSKRISFESRKSLLLEQRKNSLEKQRGRKSQLKNKMTNLRSRGNSGIESNKEKKRKIDEKSNSRNSKSRSESQNESDRTNSSTKGNSPHSLGNFVFRESDSEPVVVQNNTKVLKKRGRKDKVLPSTGPRLSENIKLKLFKDKREVVKETRSKKPKSDTQCSSQSKYEDEFNKDRKTTRKPKNKEKTVNTDAGIAEEDFEPKRAGKSRRQPNVASNKNKSTGHATFKSNWL